MLAIVLVLVFCLLVSILNNLTRADAKKALSAIEHDVKAAHSALSSAKPNVARAISFLNRWV